MKEVLVGKIVAAHGIKGLVKILPLCEDLSLLSANTTHKLTLKNALGKYILAEINGVTDRTAAEKLAGTELFAPRSALPEPDAEDSFYYDDLIGLSALTETGEPAGRVLAVHNYGASDLLEIQPPEGESYLLPYTDYYVPAIDMTAGTLTIRPIEMV